MFINCLTEWKDKNLSEVLVPYIICEEYTELKTTEPWRGLSSITIFVPTPESSLLCSVLFQSSAFPFNIFKTAHKSPRY